MILLVFAKKNFKIYLFFNFYVNLNCLKKIIFQNRMATKIKDKTRDKDLKIKDFLLRLDFGQLQTFFKSILTYLKILILHIIVVKKLIYII